MTSKDVDESIKEAKRYISRCEELKERLKGGWWINAGCKESAAVKRASMDLSRILVKVRNG